jgi:hypothetical protein
MRGMARFRHVETYPATGFPDRVWGPHPESPGDPLVDAFLRAARPVVELYSRALGQLDLRGPRASMVIHASQLDGRHHDADDTVRVSVWSAPPHGMPAETAFVHLGAATGRLDPSGRAGLALEVVHASVTRLASARGWDPGSLANCRDHVVAHGFAYAWASAWKSAPDRRHRARATFRIAAPDGFGRARLEVRRRADDELVANSEETLAFCTSAGLQRSARTLRWDGPHAVRFVPFTGLVSPHDGGPLVARSAGGRWDVEMPQPVAVRAPEGEGIDEVAGAPVPAVVAELA